MASEYRKQEIDMFYLGGLPAMPEGRPNYVTGSGEAFAVPDVGESIRLPRYIVEDLMKKYNVHGRMILSQTRQPIVNMAPAAPQREYTALELMTMLAKLQEKAAASPAVVIDTSGEIDGGLPEAPEVEIVGLSVPDVDLSEKAVLEAPTPAPEQHQYL